MRPRPMVFRVRWVLRNGTRSGCPDTGICRASSNRNTRLPTPATGFYQRTFTVAGAWKNERVFLRFEGVLYGFEAWLNGKPVGSWGSAFNPVTFDITDQLDGSGENTLSVRVTTASFANEFDHHDCWGLAGIYRDVWLFTLPESHLRSWTAQTTLREDGMAEVRLPVEVSKAAHDGSTVEGTITDADGHTREIKFNAQEPGHYEGTLQVPANLLWSAEVPVLHSLHLSLTRDGKTVHEIRSKVALREVRVDGPRLLVNGRRVKLRGVNHHDLWPDTGRSASMEQIRKDLNMILEMNANFLRTSHYPPDPRLLDLCDELGLFVMCEVPFGFGDPWLKDPAYTPELLARAAATVRRDIHRGCIIIWSIGNENPVTPATVGTAAHVKTLDPTRPVCFPTQPNGFYNKDNWKNTPATMDLHAPHYPGVKRAGMTAREITDRPVVMTEFAHQLALGGDGLQSIWDIVLQSGTLTGGAIWMFQDQGIIRRKSATVKAHPYAVALDDERFFDTASDRGADGLTYSDRIPKTNYWQARAVYAPVRVVNHRMDSGGNLTLTLANHHDFRPLTGMEGSWELFVDGSSVTTGSFASDIPAGAKGEVFIKLPIQALSQGVRRWIRIGMRDGEGRSVLIDSLRFPDTPSSNKSIMSDAGQAEAWARWLIGGEKPAIRLRVGRPAGLLSTFWAGRNGMADKDWQPHLLAPAESGVLEETAVADGIELKRKFTFIRGNRPDQPVSGVVICALPANGPLRVDYDFEAHGADGVWLEAGVGFPVSDNSTELHWIGRGPYPTYPGKNLLGLYGRHALHRDDIHFDGNRQDVGAALFIDPDGNGIALLPTDDGFDLSVERDGNGVIAGHNSRVSGVGSKFTLPDVRVEPAQSPKLGGSFHMLPLKAGAWPEPIERLLGKDRQSPEAFQPYRNPRL